MAEMRTSKIYGDLGPLLKVRHALLRSESTRVHLLGGGNIWGKGEGTLYLDHAKHAGIVSGYEVPRSLILCDEFSGIQPQSIASPKLLSRLEHAKVTEIVATIREIGLVGPFAIRSSAQVEDQLGHTAAGKFGTEFHALPLDNEASIAAFAAKLSAVYNSAYSDSALLYWRKNGFTEIPPLSVVIQEVIGSAWEYAPTYFLPAISGIVNTSQHSFVKTAIVLGLGPSAVSDEGLGLRFRLPLLENGSIHPNEGQCAGDVNSNSIFCLDTNSGQIVRLEGDRAQTLMPKKYLGGLYGDYLDAALDLSDLAHKFENVLGFSVDLEWARKHGCKSSSLVQLRPIDKRPIISRPQVQSKNVLVESKDVLGYGEKEFNQIIYVNSRNGTLTGEIDDIFQKYPNSLIIYRTDVIRRETKRLVYEQVLPYSEAVVIFDSNKDHNSGGTGMQHLALNLADDKKIIICSLSQLDFLEKGEIVEARNEYYGEIKVLRFDGPIHLAADDDFDLAMVYLK